jgi:hypothetical protein
VNVKEFRQKIIELRDSTRQNQLATYVANVNNPDGGLIGWEEASLYPLERLEFLFEEDDWGRAWELMNAEQTEYFEQDEGRIGALSDVLALIDEVLKEAKA